MAITDERKKFLKSIFTPPSLPRVSLIEVKRGIEMFYLLNTWEERINCFDKMPLKDKFILFQHLLPIDQADLLIHCNTDDAEILALCTSLGAGERFVLQQELKKKNVL